MSGVDLPNKFEAALLNTTLMENEINTAMADKNNIGIELTTIIGNATNTQQVVINQAKAKASADIQNNQAAMASTYNVIVN